MSGIRKTKYINLAVCFVLLAVVYVAMVTFVPKMSLWSQTFSHNGERQKTLEPGESISYSFESPFDRLTGITLFFDKPDGDTISRINGTVTLSDATGNTVYSSDVTTILQDSFSTGSLAVSQGEIYTIKFSMSESCEPVSVAVADDGSLAFVIRGLYEGAPSKNLFAVVYLVMGLMAVVFIYFYGENDIRKTGFYDKIILGVMIFLSIIAVSHFFDLFVIGRCGLGLIDAVLKGEVFRFYDYAYMNELDNGGLRDFSEYAYNTITYIPIAIIMIPFRFFTDSNIGFGSVANAIVLYLDAVIAVLVLWAVRLTGKICDACEMPENYKKSVKYIFAFSPVLLSITIGSGQIDIIYIIIMLYALPFYYLRKYKTFSLIMAFAVAVKPLPLMAFIPMILLVNKKVKDIVINMLICVSVTVMMMLVFERGIGYKMFQSFVGTKYSFTDRIFEFNIAGILSLFIVAFTAICIACYMKNIDTDDKKQVLYYSMLVIFAVYASFTAFISWHHQWLIPLVLSLSYLIPFMADQKKFYILSYAMYLLIIMVSGSKYGTVHMISYGLLVADGYSYRGISLYEAISNIVPSADMIFVSLLASVTVALTALFVIKNPYRRSETISAGSDFVVDRTMAVGGIFIYGITILLSYWLYCYTG